MAKQKYKRFCDMCRGTRTQQQIGRSSLTVAGWAAADVGENQGISRDRAHREAQEESVGGGCWAFGALSIDGAAEQNDQVAKLIEALGENDAGKMAILKAVSERHGVVDKEKLRRLASDEASDGERLHIPGHLRGALCEIGLHCAIAPVNVKETVETQVLLIANED